jgi:hypothetical protein
MLFFKDPTPSADNVTAGGLGAIVFLGLLIALILIGYFMSKQLKKAQAHKDANTYQDPKLEEAAEKAAAEADAAASEGDNSGS